MREIKNKMLACLEAQTGYFNTDFMYQFCWLYYGILGKISLARIRLHGRLLAQIIPDSSGFINPGRLNPIKQKIKKNNKSVFAISTAVILKTTVEKTFVYEDDTQTSEKKIVISKDLVYEPL